MPFNKMGYYYRLPIGLRGVCLCVNSNYDCVIVIKIIILIVLEEFLNLKLKLSHTKCFSGKMLCSHLIYKMR